MIESARTLDRRLFLAYVVGSLIAIFYLPHFIPLHPTASDSYLFGYNNRAGVALLLLLVSIGAIWTRGLNLKFCTTAVSQPIPRRTLIVTLAAVMFGCLAMYAFAGRFGGFGESSYEIDRAWLLSQGKIPYVDFEWPFGAGLIYGPLLISRLLSVNIVQGYYLFWMVNCLLGTLLLFAVINLIDYPTRSKRAIYLLVCCGWLFSIVNMGTHYTLLRYTCPLFFILIFHKLFKRSGGQSRVYAVLVALAFTAVLLLISPEIAIAFVFACTCIFLLSAPVWSGKALAAFASSVLALAIFFWAASRLHELDTVKASGGGADSFPILPAPHLLFFFAGFFLCACYVFRCFSQRRFDDNCLGLIAFSVPMLAAALGRCDPQHVFLNGLAIFLVSMFYVSNHPTAWKWYRAAFILFLILIPVLTGTWLYRALFERCGLELLSENNNSSLAGRSLNYIGRKYIEVFAPPAKRAKWENTLENLQNTAVPMTVDLSTIYPTWHGTFLAPFGYKPNGIGSYLSNQVDYGHFEGFENANTVDAIQQKLAEIKTHPEEALLLPDHFEQLCQIDVATERREISMLFAFPYIGGAVHPENVRQPICDYIFADYRMEQAPSPQVLYGLWTAKPPEVKSTQYRGSIP